MTKFFLQSTCSMRFTTNPCFTQDLLPSRVYKTGTGGLIPRSRGQKRLKPSQKGLPWHWPPSRRSQKEGCKLPCTATDTSVVAAVPPMVSGSSFTDLFQGAHKIRAWKGWETGHCDAWLSLTRPGLVPGLMRLEKGWKWSLYKVLSSTLPGQSIGVLEIYWQ